MASSKWLQGCEICNVGLVNRVDDLVAGGISVRKACKLMAEEGERKIGDMVYSQAAIRARYLLHKGLREPHPEVVHREPPTSPQAQPEQKFSDLSIQEPEGVVPEPGDLSAEHTTEAIKASANAKKPKPSELEKAEKIIVKAARLLEAIVEGRIKDDGSEYDRLSAESIKRHGTVIYYQLLSVGN